MRTSKGRRSSPLTAALLMLYVPMHNGMRKTWNRDRGTMGRREKRWR